MEGAKKSLSFVRLFKFFPCIALLSSMSMLFACGDMQELEKIGHVVVIGLDKAENNMVDVTFQIENPQVGSSEIGSLEKEPPSDIVTLTAPDIVSARELASSVVSRRLSFNNWEVVVISEELAKTPLSHHILAATTGDPEVRRNIMIIVSKENAADFITANKPKLETRPHKYYNFMNQRWRDTGIVPTSTLNHYFQSVTGQLYLTIYATATREESSPKPEIGYKAGEVPQKQGDPVQLVGSAVLKDGKMIGTLTGKETRIAMLLTREKIARSMVMTVTDPVKQDRQVAIQVFKQRPTAIRIETREERPKVKATIFLKVQVISIPSLIDYVLNMDNQTRLKRAIEDQFTTAAEQLTKKTQEQFKSEPFKWYLQARKNFSTWKQYDQYDWNSKYPTADIEIEVKATLESFGKQFKPSRISPSASKGSSS